MTDTDEIMPDLGHAITGVLDAHSGRIEMRHLVEKVSVKFVQSPDWVVSEVWRLDEEGVVSYGADDYVQRTRNRRTPAQGVRCGARNERGSSA